MTLLKTFLTLRQFEPWGAKEQESRVVAYSLKVLEGHENNLLPSFSRILT